MKLLSKIKDLYLANKETKVVNRVLAAIGGFGYAAGVGTMEGGLGLAIIAMGCLVVLVARSEALEGGVCHRRSRRDRF